MIKFNFSEPLWFLLLILIVPMYFAYKKNRPYIKYSLGRRLKLSTKKTPTFLRHCGFFFRILAFFFLVCAMARPQTGQTKNKRKSEGLDMMLVVDTSRSMLAMDFILDGKRQNRLDVSKKVLTEFIQKRPEDRLGLTIFGTNAFAYVPMTLDHDVLLRYLGEVEIGMAGDSTAIGDALGVAINRLKDLEAKSKVIILLTDGANQAGKVEPDAAGKAAAALGVRVYTIGVGSSGMVPFPTPMGIRQVRFELDETLLKEIAKTSGGKYFRAKDTESLKNIYKTIDNLEKSSVEIEVFHQYDEKFHLFLWPGLAALILELLFLLTRLRKLP